MVAFERNPQENNCIHTQDVFRVKEIPNPFYPFSSREVLRGNYCIIFEWNEWNNQGSIFHYDIQHLSTEDEYEVVHHDPGLQHLTTGFEIVRFRD